MESNSQANRIHCSKNAADCLKVQYPELPLRSRGNISIKGKGEMHTFWVNEVAEPRENRKSRALSILKEEQSELSADLSVLKQTTSKRPSSQELTPVKLGSSRLLKLPIPGLSNISSALATPNKDASEMTPSSPSAKNAASKYPRPPSPPASTRSRFPRPPSPQLQETAPTPTSTATTTTSKSTPSQASVRMTWTGEIVGADTDNGDVEASLV